jgi:V8-like Glu-specific endopeptidase
MGLERLGGRAWQPGTDLDNHRSQQKASTARLTGNFPMQDRRTPMPSIRSHRPLLAALSALLLAAAAGAAPQKGTSVESLTLPGEFDAAAEGLRQDLQAQWLLGEEAAGVAPLSIVLDAEETNRLASAPEDSGRLMVGINRAVDYVVAPGAPAFGAERATAGGLVWSGAVTSPGATALRLHFTGFDLPKGSELYVYSRRGEAFGPYTGRGPNGNGELYTNTVVGDEIRVQLRAEGAGNERVGLRMAGVVVLGERFLQAALQLEERAFCAFNASCITNASCNAMPAAITSARNGVAHLQFVVGGGTYICSGGLLNDTVAATTIPYFITANHCFSTQAQTNSLEAYFKFSTNCGSACYNPDGVVPRMLGGTLLRTNTQSDYTFLRLAGALPAGSTLLGWNSAAVANTAGTALYRISHPKGAPQAYSRHSVNTTAGTCGGWPRGRWIYSNDTLGATEGGSSGSPVMNVNGQVVGQLSGACGATPATPCDGDDRTVDGAFANYYNNVRNWLNP